MVVVFLAPVVVVVADGDGVEGFRGVLYGVVVVGLFFLGFVFGHDFLDLVLVAVDHAAGPYGEVVDDFDARKQAEAEEKAGDAAEGDWKRDQVSIWGRGLVATP